MVIVYGGIANKYFRNTTSPEQIIASPHTYGQLGLPENTGEEDNLFTLNFSERDPFLDKMYKTKKDESFLFQETTTRLKSEEKPIIVYWPSITYLGFTKSSTQEKKTAVLRIDGKLYRKREGSEIDHMKIINVEKDSIYMMLDKKEKKYFYRNAEK